MTTTSTTIDATRDAGQITGKSLSALAYDCEDAGNELRRMSNLNIGLISGRYDLTDERESVREAREKMLAALSVAGPRLRKQFRADGWEDAFQPNGEIRE